MLAVSSVYAALSPSVPGQVPELSKSEVRVLDGTPTARADATIHWPWSLRLSLFGPSQSCLSEASLVMDGAAKGNNSSKVSFPLYSLASSRSLPHSHHHLPL